MFSTVSALNRLPEKAKSTSDRGATDDRTTERPQRPTDAPASTSDLRHAANARPQKSATEDKARTRGPCLDETHSALKATSTSSILVPKAARCSYSLLRSALRCLSFSGMSVVEWRERKRSSSSLGKAKVGRESEGGTRGTGDGSNFRKPCAQAVGSEETKPVQKGSVLFSQHLKGRRRVKLNQISV